jgi:hypothetical protein
MGENGNMVSNDALDPVIADYKELTVTFHASFDDPPFSPCEMEE